MDFTPKIELFNHIDHLMELLSANGMQNFRPWRYDGYKWITFSDYKNLDTGTDSYSAQNNLAYYLSSDNARYVVELKLVLNINNIQQLQDAKESFVRTALKTFSSLKLQAPNNLLISVNLEEEFDYEDEFYFSSLKILRTKVFSWSLLIRSK